MTKNALYFSGGAVLALLIFVGFSTWLEAHDRALTQGAEAQVSQPEALEIPTEPDYTIEDYLVGDWVEGEECGTDTGESFRSGGVYETFHNTGSWYMLDDDTVHVTLDQELDDDGEYVSMKPVVTMEYTISVINPTHAVFREEFNNTEWNMRRC